MRLLKQGRLPSLYVLAALLLTTLPLSAFAQGSIFGSVTNSDASTPANGEISFFGFLDDTDEELRIETSTGAGYDAGNWFDDFQNYLTEAPGNPYDYYFYNVVNGEGFHLGKLIPNNSFQQEDILLAPVSWPDQPVGLTGSPLSAGAVLIEWNGTAGVTYHVYRRAASSNGSFFRLDNTLGTLSDAGTADSFFVDNTVDGVSSYDYLVIAEDASGNYSRHSEILTVSSASPASPVVNAIDPIEGLALGGTAVTITGSGFDPAGVTATVGASALTDVVVVSPYEITGTTGSAAAGTVDVTVTNTASGLSGTLPAAFTYVQNSPPVLAAIGPQSVTENNLLTITSSATDADGQIPLMSASNLPTGATFADNGNGTGTFNWTPGFLESGTYNVTFYATDAVEPSLVDSEQVAITVIDAGNQLPVLAGIGAQATTENVNLSFGVSATDAESTPVLTTSALPGTATFVDNGDGSGVFDWTPDFTEAGTYAVTFYATDDSSAVDSEVVAITVNDAGNQPPVLAAIGSQSTTENILLNFGVSASDADGTIPTLTTSTLPGTATFTDNGDGTGSFDWTPGFDEAGTYSVTFYASDGTATDSEIVSIDVIDAGNQAPVLAAIGPRSTTEGVQLLVNISASDPDATIPSLSTSALPGTATFADNGDGTGTFDWTPGFTDVGSYSVTFYAADGALTDSEVVAIDVLEAGNQAPIIATLGTQTGTESVLLTFDVTATDPDETIPTVSAENLPGSAAFADNGDGTGTFSWLPGFADAGTYPVTFIATDGALADTQIVTVEILEAGNQPPTLDPIGPQATAEQVQLLFTVTASDPDGTFPNLTTSTLPGTAIFTDNGDGSGTFDWTPDVASAGEYDVTFYASDGAATDSEIVTITVTDVNQAPVLAAIGAQTVDEGNLLSFGVTASDVDGDIPVLTTSALPGGAAFLDNGDGTGSFDWTTTFADSGTYAVTFYATDAVVPTAVDSEIVTITVNNVNQPVELLPIGTQSIDEGGTLSFATSATDADGDTPVLTASALPGSATYVDNGDGTGQFDWVTTFADAGSYTVTFYAADSAFPAVVDSEVVTINVGEVGNQPPQFTQINDTTANEGGTLVLSVAATDYEGNAIELSVNTTLRNYSFVDNGDGTGVLTYSPDYTDAGVDSVRFIATDDATPPLSSIMRIAVTTIDQNQPPQFEPAGPFAVDAQDTLVFTVAAFDSTDQDSGRLYLSVTDLPANANFLDNGDNTGTFTFAPTLGQVGVDTVHFIAVDDDTPAQTGRLAVQITVRSINQPPVLDPIGPRQVLEGGLLTIALSATDPEGAALSFSTKNAPENSLLTDNGDGTASFEFTPSFIQSGLYYVTFTVTDAGGASDKEVVLIQVIEAGDQAPFFSYLPFPSVVEGEVLLDSVQATDPDLDPIVISIDSSTMPANFTFEDQGGGTAIYEFSPDFTQSGSYIITVIAAAGELADTSELVVDVIEFGNHDPVLDTIVDQTISELNLLEFSVSASDIDGDVPIMSAAPLPGSATFTDNSNGTGTFRWTPSDVSAGDYAVWFYATDGDPGFPGSIDSQEVLITVLDTNRTPDYFLNPLQNKEVNEGETLVLTTTAWDPDGTTPTVVARLQGTDSLGTNMDLSTTTNAGGDTVTATFTFVPDFSQGDDNPTNYYIRFFYVDELDPTVYDSSITQTLKVFDVPQPPTMTFSAGTGPFTVTEGTTLSFTVSAVDPDAEGIATVRAEDLPANATASSSVNQLTFSFTPDFTQAGSYQVRFIATDPAPSTLADTQLVDITVVDGGDQAPYFTSVHPDTIQVFVGVLEQTTVTAEEPDGDGATMAAGPLLTGASFVDHGDNTGTYSVEPDVADLNTVTAVTFTATDVISGVADTMIIHYQVLSFMRGDADANATYTMNDIVYLAGYLFRGGPPPSPMEAGDVDLSGTVTVSDLVYMVNFLYKSGPRPPQ